MKEILMQRGINTLYHFTQTKNLRSIFQYGLLPRSVLEKEDISSSYNDDYRYDMCKNAICMSLEFPNYKMFYKLRQNNAMVDWAVLKINARVLCDFNCAYCWTNAGDSSMYTTPIQQRKGKVAFLELFEDRPGFPLRKELNIPNCYPTNPQAEILVFDEIPVDYIDKVFFENNDTLDEYKDCIPDSVEISIDRDVFLYRKDYEFWR